MSYRQITGNKHLFNEFIDPNKSELQNPFSNPEGTLGYAQNPRIQHSVLKMHPGLGRYAPRNFGELTTFSKIKKYTWIALVGAGFVGTKVLKSRYRSLLASTIRESPEIGEAIKQAESVQIPVIALLIGGPAVQLFLEKDWPMLTSIGIAGGIGYTLFKAGPSLITVMSEVKVAKRKKRLRKRRRRK